MSPLVFLFFGMRVYNASFSQILGYALPHLAASYYVTNYLFGRLRHPFFSELFETIQSIFLAPRVLSVFRNPRRPTFRVTPKTLSRQSDSLTPCRPPFTSCSCWPSRATCPAGCAGRGPHRVGHGGGLLAVEHLQPPADPVLSGGRLGAPSAAKVATAMPPVSRRHPPAGVSGRNARHLDRHFHHRGGADHGGHHGDPDGRLIIEARDSGRREYTLPVRVTRQDIGPAGMSLGCEFEPPDEAARAQIVGFVYGDSNRWKYFTRSTSERPSAPSRACSTCYLPGHRALCAISPEWYEFFWTSSPVFA